MNRRIPIGDQGHRRAGFSTDDKARKVVSVGSGTVKIGPGKRFAAVADMVGVPHTCQVFRRSNHARKWQAAAR